MASLWRLQNRVPIKIIVRWGSTVLFECGWSVLYSEFALRKLERRHSPYRKAGAGRPKPFSMHQLGAAQYLLLRPLKRHMGREEKYASRVLGGARGRCKVCPATCVR